MSASVGKHKCQPRRPLLFVVRGALGALGGLEATEDLEEYGDAP